MKRLNEKSKAEQLFVVTLMFIALIDVEAENHAKHQNVVVENSMRELRDDV